jgi:ankyrin repeat protein
LDLLRAKDEERMLELLLLYKPDLTIKNNYCQTPLEYAKENQLTAAVRLLESAMNNKHKLPKINRNNAESQLFFNNKKNVPKQKENVLSSVSDFRFFLS